MSIVRCKDCKGTYAIPEHIEDKSDYTCKNCIMFTKDKQEVKE